MTSKFFTTLFVLIYLSFNSYSQDGSAIFQQNCGACHSIGKGKLVGPDLKGTHSKYEKEWLSKWIKSSQALVKANDPVAVKLFEENGKIPMPDQALSDAEIEAVIGFISSETEKLDAPPAAEVAPGPHESKTAKAALPSAAPAPDTTVIAFSILFAIMLGVIIVLGRIIRQLTKPEAITTVNEKRLM